MEDLAIAGEFSSRNEAEIIRSLLESAGIPAFVSADDAGGMYNFKFSLSAAGGAKVYVKKSDLADAQKIIANSDKN